MRAIQLTGLLFSLGLSGCLTNVPEPDIGGVYACVVEEDCPAPLSCLQQVCEALELPHVEILNPEDGKPYNLKAEGTGPHEEFLSISATNFKLRPLAESQEAIPGEGHLVVFVDDQEVAKVDSGELSGGVQVPITFANVGGVHRISVQARLNNGTNYDNPDARARTMIWVNDGKKHVAFRLPWPGDSFPVDEQLINAEVAVFDPAPTNKLTIGPPNTGKQHVHVFYDESFPLCIDTPACVVSYEGIVPSDMDDFGPVLLPSSGVGKVSLTAVVMISDHTIYRYPDPLWVPDPEMPDGMAPLIPIFSSIDIMRTED